jgi:hypothetical protein
MEIGQINPETYLDRCVSACNLYVEGYNSFWKDHVEAGIVEPLDDSFKADRFKSMTGLEWKPEYEGYKRSRVGNKVSLDEWIKEQGGQG